MDKQKFTIEDMYELLPGNRQVKLRDEITATCEISAPTFYKLKQSNKIDRLKRREFNRITKNHLQNLACDLQLAIDQLNQSENEQPDNSTVNPDRVGAVN